MANKIEKSNLTPNEVTLEGMGATCLKYSQAL